MGTIEDRAVVAIVIFVFEGKGFETKVTLGCWLTVVDQACDFDLRKNVAMDSYHIMILWTFLSLMIVTLEAAPNL